MQTIFQRLRALFSFVPTASTPARPVDLPDEVPVSGEPEWLKIARQDLGIKEVPSPNLS